MKLDQGKLNIVIDGQWGSTGKGKLYAYLYDRHKIDFCICDFMPNAGHTAYIQLPGDNPEQAQKVVSKIMPIGAWIPGMKYICIGPHAVFDKDRFLEEYATIPDCNKHKVYIHPMASVICKEDALAEKVKMRHIASTMQGSCEAVIKKMRRDVNKTVFARDVHELTMFIENTYDVAHEAIVQKGLMGLAETAQGFDLGLNNGWAWPYVTSRDCLLGRVMDNAGLNPRNMGKVIASLRTFPIRVGNIDGGYSGPFYPDQLEMTWAEISELAGREVCEYTTVTKRVRRVFTWSNQQVARFCKMCNPDYAFLNFVNYFADEEKRKSCVNGVGKLLKEHNCELALLGTGPMLNDMIEM